MRRFSEPLTSAGGALEYMAASGNTARNRLRKRVADALPPGISSDDIRVQLKKILASPIFQSSARLSNFLAYAVNRTLEGKLDEMTQQSIGAIVFERSDFDATADSAVRVEAGRLRAKLREYYTFEGTADPIAINLPKGRYIPSFASTSGNRQGVSDKAFRLYAEGRRLWAKRTPGTLDSARQYFQDALTEEPRYVAASAALAECYAFMAIWGFPPREVMPKAKDLALAAIFAQNTCAEAYAVLAFVESSYDWDWDQAERHFRHAIRLDPKCLATYCWYGSHLLAVGRAKEAVIQTRRAQELDPTSVLVNAHAAKVLYVAGRYDNAIDLLLSMREENPNFYLTHWYLGLALFETTSSDIAMESLLRAAELAGDSSSVLASLGHVHATRGNVDAAHSVIGRLAEMSRTVHVPATNHAIVFAGLGDMDTAFQWMEKAYQERALYLTWLGVWPLFKRLRSDSRYFDLLERVELATRLDGRAHSES